MKSAIRTNAFGVSRKRRLLQCGTALPLLLAAWPALAQPIVEITATDIVVDEPSATGTPAAIDLRSSGGSITAEVDAVTATATAGQRNNVTNFDTANGAISASLGTVTLTGGGELLGVRAVSQGGDIDVHVGEMTLDGAITSGVQAISVDGDVTVSGDNVLLRGLGADTAGGFFPEGLLARSDNGAATVVAGSVETRGQSGSAIVAVAGDAASVTVANAIAHSDGAVTIYASAAGNATVDAGNVSMLGNGAGIQAFSNGGSTTVTADSVTSRGGGVFGRGVTGVSLNAGTVDAVDYGLSGRSDVGGAVSLSADSVTVSGGTTIGMLARTTGDVAIDAGSVSVTGPGVDPGVRPDGMRYDQGGIVVLGEGGTGAIAIDAGTVSVAGEYRYGISARGNGAITIAADEVTLASADSVAVVARGGDGAVSLTTGTVTTTGASGVGVFGNTIGGDVTIDAGTTRVENTGFAGLFTGDAIVGMSFTGDVSITSDNAFSAALYGSAIYGHSDGDVSIVSGIARTTGDGGVAVLGSSANGALSIAAEEIVTSGANTGAINAYSETGSIAVDVGTITATGANASGIFAQFGTGGATIDVGSISTTGAGIVLRKETASAGTATVNVTGDISSGANGIDVRSASATTAPNSFNTTINVAEGASISGAAGIGASGTFNNGQPLPPVFRTGLVTINNQGEIAGTGGTAIALGAANGIVANGGTITGNVVLGGGMVLNGGTIDGSVTLNTQVGNQLSVFGYEGSDTGVTGTITGGAAIDTYAQIFNADGTAVIGGGLPTAFDRYGVVTGNADTTVIVETSANPVGATPALFLMGEGKIVNRADLSASVIQGAPGTAPLVVPALYSYGFASVQTPFGPRFVFEGAGTGPSSVTNEADITGRIALTTSEFVNSGTITRSSAGVPSFVTARAGHAFSFSNTGTIAMTDGGVRVSPPLNGNPFNDVNPYNLPETAMTIRSAVDGTLDAEGLYVPVEISNSGLIDGGLLVRMTASTFAFDNSGRIEGFSGAQGSTPGLVIGLGTNWDAGVGDQFNFRPPATLATEVATFVNSGEIADSAELHLTANVVEVSNTGAISGNANNPDALFVEHSLEQDGVDTESFTLVNTGELDGNVGLELEAVTASITNGGSIIGHEYVPSQMTFSEIMFGGEPALEIENGTNGDGTLSFVNTGSIVNTGHAASGVVIEVEAGDEDPDLGGEPVVGNATVAVVNSGTISATGGATVVPQQLAQWLQPGQVLINPLAALAVDATDVNGESSITIDNQAGGTIRADGLATVATPNGYLPIDGAVPGAFTVAVYATGKQISITNAGTIEGGNGFTPGPNVVYEDIDLYDGYLAGAIHTAGDEYDTPDGEVYIASVDHVTNTATGKIVGSIDLGGNDDVLVNAGSITGNVFLRDGDDVLELHASSIIDGTVDLGEGTDEVRLAGTGPNVGRVATTLNAELLAVTSGSWRAEGLVSAYDAVSIGQGATLTVVENEEGSLAIETSSVALNGVLNLDLSVDETEGDFGATPVTGSGQLHLVGTARVELTDASGLQHTGGTFVDNGELLLATEFGGDITTTGDGVFELGALGNFTGDLVNNGMFVFSREDDYSFTGDFSGTGSLQKYGAGTLSFGGLYAFTGTTEIHAGLVQFTGQLAEDTEVDLSDGGVLDLSNISGGQQTIAQLEGQGGTLQLGETNLVIDQGQNSVFSGEISGSGTIEKQGEGDLKLEGDGSGFTGTGEVGGGTLSVNGNFSNANFVVNQGGTLGGSGTVGETNVNGGTLAPGNSIDTLTVNGNVAFTAASVFEVEVNAAGQGDRLNATGTADLGGARVVVIAENGTYRPLTDYTILTAAGGLGGTRFGSVTDNLAFLDPSLIYSANAVTLRLVRNDIDFAAFGATPNQAGIGGLIESFGYGNTLYNETLLLADGSVAPSFASLTGEVYPTHSAALVETAEMLRRQVADVAPKTDGAFLWATGLYNTVEGGGMDLDGQGVAGGFGYGAGGFNATAGLGLLDQGDGGPDYLDGDLTFAVAQLGYDWMSGLSVSAGVQFGWADAVTRRQTLLGAINSAVTGEIDGDYLQLFGELAYSLAVGGGMQLEPFAGISHVSVDLDGVTESGAATALAVSAIERDVTFADLGLRLSGDVGSGVRPFASAAYRHAWGDRASVAAVGFAGTTGSTLIGALPVAESAAELSAGLVVTRGAIDFEVSYDGTISDTFDSHGVSAGIKVRF